MEEQQKPQEPSLGQKLAALREKHSQVSGKSVGAFLSEAQEGLMYSGDFFKAMRVADSLGIAYFRNVLGYPLSKAIRYWEEKSWKDQVEFLKTMAPGNEDAEKALETIHAFSENDLLRQTLQTVIDEIGRPSRKIYSETQFNGLLQGLKIDGLAMELRAAPGWRRAFRIERGDQEYWYTPTSLIKARLAWPFVVKALGRVRTYAKIQEEIMPRIQNLLDQANLESNPEEQPLHKLLTLSQAGSLVVWDADSRIGQEKTGLLAVLIGRITPASNLFSFGWAADKPLFLPQNEEYELPSLLVYERPDGGLEVGFERSHLPKKEYDSVNRIQWAIRRWLGQEGKFRVPALQAKPPQPQPRKNKKRDAKNSA